MPVLVGSLSPSRQAAYGKIFAKYIADPKTFFIISSDFCHWGKCCLENDWTKIIIMFGFFVKGQRFHFTPYDHSCGEICESIEKMDREGMKIIESLDPLAFNDYLKRTNNTICGRHPICVMLQVSAKSHFSIVIITLRFAAKSEIQPILSTDFICF